MADETNETNETNGLYKITYKTSDEVDPIVIPLLADEAEKLENAQELQVALGSEAPQSFDGSEPAKSIGVDGVLPVGHGGTGAESLADITVGKATEAEKVGSTTVGGVATPIYNKAGVLTKIGDGANDVGGDTYPIYLTKDGELKSVANEIAKKSELSDGTVTKIGTSDVGTSTEPIYIKAGVPTATDGTLDKDISGNAATTTKLKTARTLTVDLTSESTPSFDGSENVTIGVQETLPVSHGGTGQTDLDKVAVGVAKAIGTAVGSLTSVGSAAQPVYFADGVPVATTSVGALIDLEMDEEYKITAKLMNNAGTVIATSDAIDLPLEEMVIGGKYDKDTKTLSLKIRNKDDDGEDDSWLDIPVGDLIDGLVSTSDMASATENGLMSSEDYIKLQGIEESANNYSLPVAAKGTRGGVQIGYTQSGKNYPVELSSEQMYVNVPWTDTTYGEATDEGAGLMSAEDKAKLDKIEAEANKYSLPLAASGTRGGVQIGYSETNSGSDSARNYAVQLSSEKMYVNVPWTDTVYTLPVAKSDTLGGVKVGFSTSATDRNYAVEIDASNNLYVNVPWTDTVPSIPGYNLTYGDKTIILKKDGETLDTVNLETAIGYASSLNNGLMNSEDYNTIYGYDDEEDGHTNGLVENVAGLLEDLAGEITERKAADTRLQNYIDKLPYLEIKVVGELPETGDEKYLYLVKDEDAEGTNLYYKYLWIDNAWEDLGASRIELGNYYTREEADAKFILPETGNSHNPVYINSDGTPVACFSSSYVAIGNIVTCGTNHDTALGYRSTANGGYSIASGYYAKASGSYAVALGGGASSDYTTASGDYSVALGYKAKALGENSIALGAGAIAENDDEIALGSKTLGASNKGIYLKAGVVTATDELATASELSALKGEVEGITIPSYTMDSSTTNHTISLLKDGTVVGSAINLATVIGMASDSSDGLMSVSDYNKLAGLSNYELPTAATDTLGGIMTGFTATDKNYAVVVDDDGNAYVSVPWTDTTYGDVTSSASGLMTSALYTKLNGLSINGSSSWDSLSIVAPTGYGTKGQYLTTNDNADGFTWKTLEAGTTLTATGSSSVPVYINSSGQPATCSNISADTAVKVGNGATASGSAAVAVGGGASAVPGSAIALGRYASCPKSGTRPIAIGRYAESSGAYSIAIGSNSGDDDENTIASGDHAVAIGLQAEAAYEDSIAIGYGTKTTKTGEVVIGNINLTELKELVEQLEQLIKVGKNTATQLVFEEE